MFALCGRKSVCRLSVVCNTGATEGLTFRQYFTPSYSLGTRFVLKFCKETRRIFGWSCNGGTKNWSFWPISRFMSETIQYMAIVTMEDEYAIYRMVPISMTWVIANLDFNVTILFNVT